LISLTLAEHGPEGEQIPRIFHGSEWYVYVSFCAILPVRFLG
jgi:hypothetical protein